MTERQGPLNTGRFTVEIEGVQVDGFRVVDLPARSTKETEYREDTDQQKRVWGRTEYDDLKMERGVKPGDTKLYDWRRAVDVGKADEGRKEIAVALQDEQGGTAMRWKFTEAWPSRYDPPTLDATASGGDGDVATESVTIVYDKMERTK